MSKILDLFILQRYVFGEKNLIIANSHPYGVYFIFKQILEKKVLSF